MKKMKKMKKGKIRWKIFFIFYKREISREPLQMICFKGLLHNFPNLIICFESWISQVSKKLALSNNPFSLMELLYEDKLGQSSERSKYFYASKKVRLSFLSKTS